MCKPNKMNGAKGVDRRTKVKGIKSRVNQDDWLDEIVIDPEIDNLLKEFDL